MRKVVVGIIALIVFVGMAGTRAYGWRVTLQGHHNLPPLFFAIDKGSQEFLMFGQKSPLQVLKRLPCATGKRPGDKLRQGDLRTPEGVYFLEKRLDSGLNFERYGKLAYTLNFPNPVDRIKGKTGSGIWIHGRGRPIVPRESKGCVVLNAPDLFKIQGELSPGLPVAIAEDVLWASAGSHADGVIDALVQRVRGWAKDWQNKESRFFAHYDPVKFSLSRARSFKAFRRKKERIFRTYPWVQVMAHDIRVMPGPDYWVTYFHQYYRTPALATQGLKRLYWQKDKAGDFRIIGREWTRTRVDLTDVYLDRVREELVLVLEDWRKAWEAADLDKYTAFYADRAGQGGREGLRAVREYKQRLWAETAPKSVEMEDLRVTLHPEGAEARFTQRYQAENGYKDAGVKTLVLEPADKGWKIVSEDWSAL